MKTGNFGKVREAYVAARQEFPQEVIEYIWQHIATFNPKILDLGCGTGIATRQLAEKREAMIVGSDVDSQMIEAAQEISVPNITYLVAQANSLPFADGEFDGMTAFSAFHWFRDEKSLTEIQRVLKKGATFFVVNKNDIRGFRKGYKSKLSQLLGKKLSSPKEDYDPATILQKADFLDVTKRVFLSEERFAPPDALRHIQSASAWGEVTSDQEQQAIELMHAHIAESIVDGQVIRELEVVVVSGSKL